MLLKLLVLKSLHFNEYTYYTLNFFHRMHINNIDSPQLPTWKQRGSVPIGELTNTANKMAKKEKISKLDIKI